jgi:hypothetical protein
LQVLVLDSEDGKPLAQNEGPLRLVVPADKRPAPMGANGEDDPRDD